MKITSKIFLLCWACALVTLGAGRSNASGLQLDSKWPPDPHNYTRILDVDGISDQLRFALNLSACGNTKLKFSNFINSYLFVGNPNTNCTQWVDAIQGISVESASVAIGKNLLPVVVYSSSSPNPTSDFHDQVIYIHVTGGPGGGIQPIEESVFFTNLLQNSDILVSIGYTGTGYGSTYPDPDFNIAVDEVATYTSTIQARNPHAKVVLIGVSLGSVIISGVLNKKYISKPDKVIMISPLIYSPQTAAANFREQRKALGKVDATIPVRTYKWPSMDWQDGDTHQIATQDLLEHFFPTTDQNIDLAQRLKDSCAVPILLMYGTKDSIIGVERISELEKLSCLTVSPIEGMGHVAERKYFDIVDQRIVRFVHQ